MRVRFDAASRLVSPSLRLGSSSRAFHASLIVSASLVASPALATNYLAELKGGNGSPSWTVAANWKFPPDDSVSLVPNNGTNTFDVKLPTDPTSSVNITFDASIAVNSLDMTATNDNVTLSSTDVLDFTIKNTLTWNAGTLAGAGSTILVTGATANISGPAIRNGGATLAGRTLVNNGSVIMDSAPGASGLSGTLNITGTASIHNAGTWTLQDHANINYISSGDFRLDTTVPQITNAGVLDIAGDDVAINPTTANASSDFSILAPGLLNTGTLVKSAGTGTSSSIGSNVENAGVMRVQVGTLVVQQLLQSAGQTHVDAGATMEVDNFYVKAGKLSGAGTITPDDALSFVELAKEPSATGSPITLAPGDEDQDGGSIVGTLTSQAGVKLGDGVRFEVQIGDATGDAGLGWDLLDVTNTTSGLSISDDASIVVALSAKDLTNFSSTTPYEWAFARAGSNLLTGYDRDLFSLQVDTTGFGALPSNASWDIVKTGDVLYVTYSAVPEPASLGLVAVTSTLLLRRRKQSGQ